MFSLSWHVLMLEFADDRPAHVGRITMDNLSADLVMRWRDGDQRAAGELFERYAERLIALASSRLSARLARHVDPEDVVQSAYRSFFVGARDGRYVLGRSGDLWRLLVAITLHKLQHQVERHTAGKRSVVRECRFAAGGTGLDCRTSWWTASRPP